MPRVAVASFDAAVQGGKPVLVRGARCDINQRRNAVLRNAGRLRVILATGTDVTILCGTDASGFSRFACATAATLARKTHEQLIVLHVVTSGASDRSEAAVVLHAIADEARARGVDVVERIESGSAHSVIANVAAEVDARLIVLAAASSGRSPFGSTVDRVISVTNVPVLLVRDGFPAEEWVRDERPLRVAVATDLSPISDAAALWASTLEAYGRIDLTALHVEWPAEAYERIGIEGPMPLDRTHPIVEQLVRREIESATRRMSGDGREVAVIVETASKQAPEAITRMASSAKADLLVIGHRPQRMWRVWEGSVARAVLRLAGMTVACVPDVDVPVAVETTPIRCIVAATDLSPHGNAAVSYALSLAPRDSQVVIVHVLDRGTMSESERARIVEGLSTLAARRDVVERRIHAAVEIVDSVDPAQAIVSVTGNHNADLVCISGRGRSRLPRLMLGSVAQQVLLLSRCPVLVVP